MPDTSLETLRSRHAPAWTLLWQAFGAPVPEGLLEALLAHYAEPHRHYHTQAHLDACLAHFGRVRAQADRPHEVEMALWFHDAIYAIGAPDNEQRSADWARSALLQAGARPDAADRVAALVMVTRHDCAPATTDQALLLDADLSILGQRPAVFDAYERQVRTENGAVPEDFFRRRRQGILQQFLDRPRIYHSAPFFEAFEAQARANLARSIRQLGE
jgi:predicted metal-dependent HD superfamily phosphohydrolase